MSRSVLMSWEWWESHWNHWMIFWSDVLPGGGGGAWGEAFESPRRWSSSAARWTTILIGCVGPLAQLISDALCLARLLDATLTGRCPAFQSTPCFMVAEKGKTVQAGIPKKAMQGISTMGRYASLDYWHEKDSLSSGFCIFIFWHSNSSYMYLKALHWYDFCDQFHFFSLVKIADPSRILHSCCPLCSLKIWFKDDLSSNLLILLANSNIYQQECLRCIGLLSICSSSWF